MKNLLAHLALAAALGSLFISIQSVLAQGTTAFTYQGQLNDDGTNVNGTNILVFALYDAASDGTQIGSANTNNLVLVTNGFYTVTLDFGTGAFNGSARWLETTFAGEILTPRELITTVPYALYAMTPGGPQGPQGLTGTAGLHGTQGLTGATGPQGSQGIKGNTGATGAIGPQGPRGLQGPAGTISAANGDFSFGKNGGSISGNGDGGLIIKDGSSALSVDNISLTGGNGDTGAITFDEGSCGTASIKGSCGGINITGDRVDAGDVYAAGNYTIGGQVNVAGDFAANSVTAASDIYANGLFANVGIISNNFNINSNLNVNGDVNVNGSVNAGNDDGDSEDATIAKTSATSTNNEDILNQVASLSISTWRSKKDPKIHHIGPKAHDFQVAFGLGTSDTTISLVDETGVALAAIQGLNEKLKEKNAEFQKLESQNESLEKRLADLEQLVKTAAQK